MLFGHKNEFSKLILRNKIMEIQFSTEIIFKYKNLKIYLPTLEFSPGLARDKLGPWGPGSILEPKCFFCVMEPQSSFLAKFHLKSLNSDFWGHHAERLVNVKVF